MDTTAVMDLISEKRAELEEILEAGKNLLNKDVLNKSEELDEAILTFMSGGQGSCKNAVERIIKLV